MNHLFICVSRYLSDSGPLFYGIIGKDDWKATKRPYASRENTPARKFGVISLLSAKEGPDEVTISAEIEDTLPTGHAEIAKYVESILVKKIKVVATESQYLEKKQCKYATRLL